MQFEELIIEGFGPYAGRESIDFAPLSAKGLFSVTGETGAGKTTIFDALTFGLYGRLPGHRPETSVRSEHASARQQTQVELVFTAGNDRWKVVRSPRQERPKSRGSGTTEKQATAYLYRWVSGNWESVANKSGEVNDQCRQLIGLDKSQFERVGLLPQGEFKRLLVDKSSDRKTLFRSLFGTDLVDRAVQNLIQDAKTAAVAARDARVVHETVGEEAAALLEQLQSIAVPDDVVPLAASPDDDSVIGSLTTRSTAIRAHVMPQLREAEASARKVAANASSELGRAGDVVKKLSLRQAKREQRLQLDERRESIERNGAGAERARRALPVIEAHRSLGVARSTLNQQQTQRQAAIEAVSAIARQYAIEVHDSPTATLELVGQRQMAVVAAAKKSADRTQLTARVITYTEEIQRITTNLDALDQQAISAEKAAQTAKAEVERSTAAAVRYGQLISDRVSLERTVQLAEKRLHAEDQLTARRAELADVSEQANNLASVCEAARVQLDQLQALEKTAPELQVAHQKNTALMDLFIEIDQLTATHDLAVQTHAAAAENLASVAAAFARTVAPRLAEALVPGEPCSVCGSCEHPSPAISGTNTTTTQQEVDRATQAQTAAAAELNRVDALLQAKTKQVPEGLTPAEANRQLDDSEEGLAVAMAAAPQRLTIEAKLAEVQTERTEAEKAVANCETAIAQLVVVVEQSTEELVELDASEPLEQLQTRLGEHDALITQVKAEADRLNTASTGAEQQAELLAQLAEQRSALVEDQARREENARSSLERVTALEEQLSAWEGVDLEDTEVGLGQLKGLLGQLIRTDETLERTKAKCETLQEAFDAAYANAGFPTIEEVLEAELPLDTITAFEKAADIFRSESEKCDAALAQFAQLDLPDELPDVETLQHATQAAAAEATRTTENRTAVEELVARADSLMARWGEQGDRYESLQAEADERAAVADLCNAKGSSRIGLEGFILRQHLAQVVAMANLRLDPMSRGRYQLTVADEAIKGAGEWGLDLKVIDAHTGTEREVTTLSGGETFYTSLSLALGLSDVLSSRGATAISSVFIDEGFGSLDETAIDDTIEMLNELRSDGVTIGVITHVGALRDALPVGITVEKQATGGSRVVQAA